MYKLSKAKLFYIYVHDGYSDKFRNGYIIQNLDGDSCYKKDMIEKV